MISSADYAEPKAFIHDIIVILDLANDRFVQAEVIQSYTNMKGDWRYKLPAESFNRAVGDNDIVAVHRR